VTLTIDLTPEQEAAIEAEATSRGMALPEFARLRLLEGVPAEGAGRSRKLSGYGVLAGVGGSVEEFLRAKHAETAREDAAA
jgi:hypothetical protein